MRQSGDTDYAELLASARVGIITDQHMEALVTRFIVPGTRASVNQICQHYQTLADAGNDPIMLLPRTTQCDEINSAMVKRMERDIYDIPAIDTQDTIVNTKQMTSKVIAAYKKLGNDTTRLQQVWPVNLNCA